MDKLQNEHANAFKLEKKKVVQVEHKFYAKMFFFTEIAHYGYQLPKAHTVAE